MQFDEHGKVRRVLAHDADGLEEIEMGPIVAPAFQPAGGETFQSRFGGIAKMRP